jgi:gliding motility-associated-like protein
VIISDSANCADTLTLQINEPTQLYFSLDSIRNPGCYNSFDGYIKIEARGGTPNYLYAWQPYGGNSPIASHLNANTYTVQVKDAHSCLHDTTLQLTQPEPLVITYPGDTTICYGTEAKLNVPISGGTPSYTVEWSTGDNSNPLFFKTDFDSVIAVSAKDANGCTAGPVEYRIQVLHQPAASLGNDTIMCAGDILYKSIFQPGVLYEWQDGSKYYDYEIKEAGIYWVIAFNACFSTIDSVTVKFDDCSTCVHVPDAFTPNNDGINDIFKAEIGCYFTNYLFKVFNRWGQLLYITSDPNGGWDGRNDGKAEEMGTYVWQLQYAGSEHDLSLDQKLSGYVILIR